MNVQVAPRSRVLARPQFVPTNTAFGLLALIAICHPAGSVRAWGRAQINVFSEPMFTGVQVAPASSLTLMPDCGTTRPSKDEVAYTRWSFPGSTLTSQVADGANVLILTHVWP